MPRIVLPLLITGALIAVSYGYTLGARKDDASWLNHNLKFKSAQRQPHSPQDRDPKKFNVDFTDTQPSSDGSVDGEKSSQTSHADEAKKIIEEYIKGLASEKKQSREEVKQDKTNAEPIAAPTCGYEVANYS